MSINERHLRVGDLVIDLYADDLEEDIPFKYPSMYLGQYQSAMMRKNQIEGQFVFLHSNNISLVAGQSCYRSYHTSIPNHIRIVALFKESVG